MGVCAIMLASSLTIMVGSAITSALPDLAVAFDLPPQMAGWLVTMPALGVVVTALAFGRLIDRKGARIVCTVGLVCYGVFGMAGILMPEKISLMTDRFLLGVAAAAVTTSSTALISEFFHGHARLRMMAVQGMAIEIGGIIFLSLGGFLAEVSWRGPFFIYAIAFVAWLWLYMFVPRSRRNASARVMDEAAHAGSTGKVWPVIVLSFLAMFIFFSGIVVLPMHLQVELGYGKSFTGNFLAFISLMAVVTVGVMPRVVKRVGAKLDLCVAFCCFGAAFAFFFTQTALLLLLAAAILMGIGFGLTIPLLNNLTVERSAPEHRGRNIAFYSMATFSGQFLSSVTSSLVGAHSSFAVIVGVAVLTLVYTVLIYRNK